MCPDTATITSVPTATAGQKAKATQYNTLRDNYRGHILCIDPTLAAAANDAYDLGSSDHQWRSIYLKNKPYVDGTQMGNIVVVTKTANYTMLITEDAVMCNGVTAGFTITLPTAVGNSGKVYYIKKSDLSINEITIDANGSQTIDGDLTITLTEPYMSITIVSDGTNWHVI